jgi:hypothetical protein
MVPAGHHEDVHGLVRASCVVAMSAIVACSSGGAKGDLTGHWLNRAGNPVADGTERRRGTFPLVVHTFAGSGHCGWESALFLHAAWPLGTEATSPISQASVRQFIRDPNGVFESGTFLGSLDLSLRAMPQDARYTGLHRDGNEIWFSESAGDRYVFVKRENGKIERWPRTTSLVACE